MKQLYGASKWLTSATHVIHANGTLGIALPPTETRRIHRITVAFGSGGEYTISSGNFGNGHVHVYSPSKRLYVSAYFPKHEQRELRLHELYARCLIARHKITDASDVVVGIAINEFDPAAGSTTDLI